MNEYNIKFQNKIQKVYNTKEDKFVNIMNDLANFNGTNNKLEIMSVCMQEKWYHA